MPPDVPRIGEGRGEKRPRKESLSVTSSPSSPDKCYHRNYCWNKESFTIPSPLLQKQGNDQKQWSLRDVFGTSTVTEAKSARRTSAAETPEGDARPAEQFHQLRLDYHYHPTLQGEAGKILLFRDDYPGAIAKIIFSLSTADDDTTTTTTVTSTGAGTKCRTIRATIDVLTVKQTYRGKGLGALLFTQAIQVLIQQGRRICTMCNDEQQPHQQCTCCIQFQFYAKEDCGRYNKLVRFYEQLGCRIKPHTTTQYITHNEHVYRKIPMQGCQSLVVSSTGHPEQEAMEYDRRPCLCAIRSTATTNQRDKYFIPFVLQDGLSHRDIVPPTAGSATSATTTDTTSRIDYWLLVDNGNGTVSIHTTNGHQVVVTNDVDGTNNGALCMKLNQYGPYKERYYDLCHQFRWIQMSDDALCRMYSASPITFSSHKRYVSKDASSCQQRIPPSHCALWALQTMHGSFLSVDAPSRKLVCTPHVSLWQARWNDGHDGATLVCTTTTTQDTILLLPRLYYLPKWNTQTLDYVKMQRQKYLQFNLCSMTLCDALLQSAKCISSSPLLLDTNDWWKTTTTRTTTTSLRSFCFRRAEWFRYHAYSDWMQFVALVYELGRVLKVLEKSNRGSPADNDEGHDWTITGQNWVVGCGSRPTSIPCLESRATNPDRSTTDTMWRPGLGTLYGASCGIENVLQTWSVQQYMSEFLRFNQVDLPMEAFSLLRLVDLRCWHTNGEYIHYMQESDKEMLWFVSDFDEALEQCTLDCLAQPEMCDADCERLWQEHYRLIAEKYGAAGVLQW